jgi:hypothetical protein
MRLLDEQMIDVVLYCYRTSERLMCEVEFWEVFLMNVQGFLEWCPKVPLVDYRIADLQMCVLRHLLS